MYGFSRAEVHGLDDFTALLDERADINARTRGLLTGKERRELAQSSDISHGFVLG